MQQNSTTSSTNAPVRESFSSRIGFLFLSAGCAIGLGNIWRFPFITGQYGGAWFVLIYLFFLFLFGVPMVLAELACGRASQQSIARSYDVLENPGTKWHHLKWFSMAGNYFLMMFYVPVTGWMLYYTYKAMRGDLAKIGAEGGAEQFGVFFQNMLESVDTQVLFTAIVIVGCFSVCAVGLVKGVEFITKYMMGALFLLLLVLAGCSMMLEGGKEGLAFYLLPNWQRLQEAGIGNAIYAAMGQAFFTLSIGIGSLAIFGSHLDRSRTLLGDALHITLLDTLVALLAGLIIFPACFAFKVEAGSGPGLIFLSLPNVFQSMSNGRIWGSLFFLFLSFASLSTVLAVFENILSFAMDLLGWSRRKSVLVNLVALLVLTLPCILGFSVWKSFQPFGEGSNVLDLEDFLVSNTCLPLGSFFYLVFCSSRYGWGFRNFLTEVNAGEGRKVPSGIQNYMTFVLPIVLLIILIGGWRAKFFG